jgi:hypothetical protein
MTRPFTIPAFRAWLSERGAKANAKRELKARGLA